MSVKQTLAVRTLTASTPTDLTLVLADRDSPEMVFLVEISMNVRDQTNAIEMQTAQTRTDLIRAIAKTDSLEMGHLAQI